MELKEQWIMWEPLSNLRGNYYRERLIDGYHGGFHVIIGDHNNDIQKIHINFRGTVRCYRDTYETYAWLMQQDFLRDGSYFYKVLNSKYIQWLSDISNGVSSYMESSMQHFVIFRPKSTLEILSRFEPEITFIDKES